MYSMHLPRELLRANRRASSVLSATNTLRDTHQSAGCALRPVATDPNVGKAQNFGIAPAPIDGVTKQPRKTICAHRVSVT